MFGPITVPFGAKMLFNTVRLKPNVTFEDVELAVFLFPDVGDLKRSRFVAANGRSRLWRRVAGGKIDNDARRRGAEMQN